MEDASIIIFKGDWVLPVNEHRWQEVTDCDRCWLQLQDGRWIDAVQQQITHYLSHDEYVQLVKDMYLEVRRTDPNSPFFCGY